MCPYDILIMIFAWWYLMIIFAVLSRYSMMELKEDEGAEQTLGPAQRQDFHYRFPAMDKSELGPPRALSPVLIGVSCPLGAVKFQVSSTRSFDDDPSKTTKLGKDIVLLDPRLDIMRDAAKDDMHI